MPKDSLEFSSPVIGSDYSRFKGGAAVLPPGIGSGSCMIICGIHIRFYVPASARPCGTVWQQADVPASALTVRVRLTIATAKPAKARRRRVRWMSWKLLPELTESVNEVRGPVMMFESGVGKQRSTQRE